MAAGRSKVRVHIFLFFRRPNPRPTNRVKAVSNIAPKRIPTNQLIRQCFSLENRYVRGLVLRPSPAASWSHR
jgi:hypothetical protein